MTTELLIIAALATYRLSLLISKEDAPFLLAARFRTWAGIKYDEYSNPYSTGQFSAAILCPYCLSVWVGFMVTLYIVVMHVLNLDHITIYPLLPFALSGVSAYWFKVGGV